MTATAPVEPPRTKRVIRRVPSAPNRRPSITAVIPAHNYGRFLRKCVMSVLLQPDVDVEVLIVDDCSTDDTPAIAAEIAGSDSRVSVIRHERNRGHIPSVNEGFEHVAGEYVVKLDADDLLAPGSLARSTALLEACPEVGFVYGRPLHFSERVPESARSATRSWSVWSGREWVARRCRSVNNVISQPEVVIRTAALRRALPIRADLPHTSDLHLWIQLASLNDVGRINGPIQGYYRVHDQSMQRTMHTGQLFGLEARRDAFDAAFAAEAGALSGAAELHDTARRALATEALDRACHAYDRGRAGEDYEPTDGFVTFALDTWPAARELPEWTALERRRSVGAERARRHPRFFADALARRAATEMHRWRWRRTGEL